MISSRRLFSNSPQETESLAEEFAAEVRPGDWVGLIGPLGAGKSVWARALGRGLGVTDHIVSPTFSLVNVYRGHVRFCHIDLYRVRSAEELIDLGLETYQNGNTVVVIEWADRVPELRLSFHWEVKFERLGENRRIITLEEKVRKKTADPQT